ncbi:MAG TPA: DUF2878 family protein [Nannocystaceae bacterium]|nr:DUF2878 family protein [Nannocystaceae bacterium]
MKSERIVGLILLQAASVVPLVAAALGARELGIAIAWVAVAIQLAVSHDRRNDALVMLAATVLGVGAELLLAALGPMQFARIDALGMPLWLPPSWAVFGAAFGHVLARLRGRALASFVVGAIASALALEGAIAAGEVAVAQPLSRVVIALALGAVLAGISVLASRITDASSRTPP